MPLKDVHTWLVIAPAIGLVLLGIVFIVSPPVGAAIFGLPPPQAAAAGYLPAIGVRDLAFGLYVLALAVFAGPRPVGIVLAVTALIPLGDILVLVAALGLSSPAHLLVHAASGIYMAGAAAFVLRAYGRKGGST